VVGILEAKKDRAESELVEADGCRHVEKCADGKGASEVI
jgi:hypothetical protein